MDEYIKKNDVLSEIASAKSSGAFPDNNIYIRLYDNIKRMEYKDMIDEIKRLKKIINRKNVQIKKMQHKQISSDEHIKDLNAYITELEEELEIMNDEWGTMTGI